MKATAYRYVDARRAADRVRPEFFITQYANDGVYFNGIAATAGEDGSLRVSQPIPGEDVARFVKWLSDAWGV
jgi:hypothetical protein